jgi:hypothetical protein
MKSAHVLTFISRLKKFTQEEGITSMLKVDAENTVEDALDNSLTFGGIIADIDNGLGEVIDVLEEYYTRTNNKRLLKRLNKIKTK